MSRTPWNRTVANPVGFSHDAVIFCSFLFWAASVNPDRFCWTSQEEEEEEEILLGNDFFPQVAQASGFSQKKISCYVGILDDTSVSRQQQQQQQ